MHDDIAMKRYGHRARSWPVLIGVAGCVAGLGLGACAMERPSSVPPDAVQMESRVVLEQQDAYSGLDEPDRLVIRDADTWAERWPDIAVQGGSAPAVDFARDMVLVAAMGQRSHGGHAITIEGVFENADAVYVHVLETSPGAGCAATQALVAPVFVVTVPDRDKPVLWVESSRTSSC